MKIISYNVNGIRAAIKKGFIDWLKTHPADVVCIQENKAQQSDISAKDFNDNIQCGTGHQVSDDEGRVIQLDFGKLRLINAYFPSGTTGDVRQTYKYQWLDEFFNYLQNLRKAYPNIILCGDYNIAHKEIDIHNPKGNKDTSGFLPEERGWMDKFYSNGWIDSFREYHPEPHRYSWWSQRFPGVRLANKGWRIDYISVTEPLKPFLKDAEIYSDIKHSDHCPIYAEVDTAIL
jgi:exodeoxyribonuclease-3